MKVMINSILFLIFNCSACISSGNDETIKFHLDPTEPVIERTEINPKAQNPCPAPIPLPNSIKMSDIEIGHFHRRCRAIYGHKDYCVVKYRILNKTDGSRHIDIICGKR